DLRGVKGTFNNVLPTGETAVRVGEGEAEFALGAGQLPFPQRVDEHRRQRDRALARHGLDRPNLTVAVSTLTDVDHRTLEVDVLPAQATKLARPQAGEDRGQDRGAMVGQVLDDDANFVRGGDVDADLEFATATLLGVPFAAVAAIAAQMRY